MDVASNSDNLNRKNMPYDKKKNLQGFPSYAGGKKSFLDLKSGSLKCNM